MAFSAYKITCLVNAKVYIGITKNAEKRWRDHSECEKPYSKRKTHLAHAIRKYGIHNFRFEVIAETKTPEELRDLEKILIAQYDSFRAGYNSTTGGDGPSGMTHTKEARAKISAAHTGRKIPRDIVERAAAARRGKKRGPQSPETVRKSALARTGIKQKPEQIERRRVKLIGKKRTPEVIRQMSLARKGIPLGPASEESKHKRSVSLKKFHEQNPDFHLRIRFCDRGHEYTEENVTWLTKSNGAGYRRCKLCNRANARRFAEKHPERYMYVKTGRPIGHPKVNTCCCYCGEQMGVMECKRHKGSCPLNPNKEKNVILKNKIAERRMAMALHPLRVEIGECDRSLVLHGSR